jgi:hypothetical protein
MTARRVPHVGEDAFTGEDRAFTAERHISGPRQDNNGGTN